MYKKSNEDHHITTTHSKPSKHQLNWLRFILLVSMLLIYIGLPLLSRHANLFSDWLPGRRWKAMILLGWGVFFLDIVLLVISFTPLSQVFFKLVHTGVNLLKRLRALNLAAFGLLLFAYVWLIFSVTGRQMTELSIRLLFFWGFSLGGSIFLKAWGLNRPALQHTRWINFLGIAIITGAFIHGAASFASTISTYPFTISWSETSRYYYASLFFSERIYGIQVPPTVLHPSRYLMQAVPFLFRDSPLWLHRAWQVFLWLALPLVTGYALVRRLPVSGWPRRLVFTLWSATFLLLGPVYYHLLVPVLIVLWGYQLEPSTPLDRRQLTRTILVVLAASAWAGISRINWFPVPGMLAASLYFLEIPLPKPKPTSSNFPPANWPWLRYLIPPAAWTIAGTGIAFASQALYIYWSGNPVEQFATSFSSNLLWYRLWPNSTFPLGILPGALLVSLPLFLLIAAKLLIRYGTPPEQIPAWRRYHPIRWLGLAAILLILLTGGLIVSVKIGGGSNLHNLDAYLAILLVVSAMLYFDCSTPDLTLTKGKSDIYIPLLTRRILDSGIFLAILIPSLLTVLTRSPISLLPEEDQITKGLEIITRVTGAAAENNGEVLFISNRHLLTFKQLAGITLIPEYERVFLMELAMAGPDYLEDFHRDIKEQRFALIISEPLYTQQKDETSIFGEENNAWVQGVSKYILCYYEERRILRDVSIQLLVPKSEIGGCP